MILQIYDYFLKVVIMGFKKLLFLTV